VTTAVIGTGGLGSTIVRLLAAGGEKLRLSSPDAESVRRLVVELDGGAIAAVDNRDALRGADTVVLALRFRVLQSVVGEIAEMLTDTLVIVPSNPVSADAQGNVRRLLPEGQHSGQVVKASLPRGVPLCMAFGTMSADLLSTSSNRLPDAAVLFYVTDDDNVGTLLEPLIRKAGFEPAKVGGMHLSDRLEVGGDLHDVVVALPEARSLIAGNGSDSPDH
jgi:hypothetical protein